MIAPLGLTDVSTDVLRELLRLLHRGQIQAPLTPAGLAAARLQDFSEPLMRHLRGLEGVAVRAVLVAVIAERTTTERGV